MAQTLEEQVAIVTGAGRGIGRGEALELARAGAAVVVNDLGGGPDGLGSDSTPAQEVVDQITSMGGRAIADYADVTDYDACQATIQRALDAFGRLDILINNAGNLRDRMIFNMSEEEWDSVIAVHLKGHFNMIRHAAPIFRQQKSGAIVNTGSESGLGSLGQANYSAAKEGIIGLTRTVAQDLGKYNGRCNAIRPRAATRLTMSDEMREAAERATAAGKVDTRVEMLARLSPEMIAPFVVWLCTDSAKNVNGRTFLVSADEITLMTEPSREKTLFSAEGGWTLDYLRETLPRTVAGGLRNKWALRE
jgi:NAD(P)-dependent dehydrogenase (short-subunit alcohol dehydrogenase family)